MEPTGDTKRQIVELLKRRTSATVAELTEHLDVTGTAVRQHLDDLEANGLVERLESVSTGGRGRPRHPWALTSLAAELFPDRHADLTVELITAIIDSVGEDGLDAIIAKRTERQRSTYLTALDGTESLEARAEALASIRSAEGYMADVTTDGDALVITEHHCPVCDAASACQGLCRDELELFREVLGADATVERTSHLLSGDNRCAYTVTPVSIGSTD